MDDRAGPELERPSCWADCPARRISIPACAPQQKVKSTRALVHALVLQSHTHQVTAHGFSSSRSLTTSDMQLLQLGLKGSSILP